MNSRRVDPDAAGSPPPQPVRVLFVIGTLDIGGAEKQVVEIAAGLDRQRFAAAVCCLGDGGALAGALAQRGVQVWSAGIQRISRAGWLRAFLSVPVGVARLFSFVSAFRPAVLQGMLFHAYVLGTVIAVLTRVPVVITGRRSLALFKQGRTLYSVADRVVNRWTDAIVANSEAVRQDTIVTERVAPELVTVIHNGVDLARYAPPGGRDRPARVTTAPVAVVLANFIHYKGHRYFLEAWQAVCQRLPGATAVFVGDGPLLDACRADAATRGLTPNTQFLGARQDVPDLLAAADLLVHPSLEEGFSNAILEGMASGLPVVATSVGGNAEAVQEGVTGLLVPPRDSRALAEAIVSILERADRGRAMGQAGRARVEAHFQLPAMVRRYEQLYTNLLGQQRDG